MIKGVGLLARGIAVTFRRSRLVGLGAIPPLITSILMIGLLVLLGVNAAQISAWMTPFADTWAAREIVRGIVVAVLFIGSTLLMVLTFSAIALAIGAPVYDKIAEHIDNELGAPAQAGQEKIPAMVGRVVAQVLGTAALSVLGALICFLLGLIPVAGAVAGAIATALFGGWMMARELVGPAFEHRGRLTMAERSQVLRRHKGLVLGFGVPAFWLLSIPLVSVVVFPGAVAGATMVTREMFGESTRPGA